MEKINKKFPPLLLDILYTTVGCIIMAAGMNIFTIPNDLAPGGFAGLATAIAYLVPIPVGVLTFIFNIIVLLFALKVFGIKSMLMSIYASVAYSLFIDLFSLFMPGYTDNVFLASILGGSMIGLGLGFLFMRNISTAGTDMVAKMLKLKFPQMQTGTATICVDATVVLIAIIIFRNIEIGLYSGVAIFCLGKVLDAVMHGVDYAKVLMIVTKNPDIIEETLCNECNRGVTELPAKGGYSKEGKAMLLTVARRSEVAETLRAVKTTDPEAFVIIYDATEVRGKGFKQDEL